jgi:hypothetical protein
MTSCGKLGVKVKKLLPWRLWGISPTERALALSRLNALGGCRLGRVPVREHIIYRVVGHI